MPSRFADASSSTYSAILKLALALGFLLLQASASAYTNDIQIYVAKGRLTQCGSGWDPEHTGRWGGQKGSIYVNGQKVHEFNLAETAECSRITRVKVNAGANEKIDVYLSNEYGRMSAPLTTVAADRVWFLEYFADSFGGGVISTDWPSQDAPKSGTKGNAGLEFDTNRYGQDYKNLVLDKPDPALCRNACESEAKCKAWSYVKPGLQGKEARCWLKHSVPGASRDACCVSGVSGK